MWSGMTARTAAMALTLCFLSCASEDHRPPPAAENSGPNLTKFEAEIRAQQVSDIHYQISVDLTQSESFTGTVNTDFIWTQKNNSDLRMDFSDGTVQTVRINGHEVHVRAGKQYLILPAERMQAGVNHVLVNFTHKYADDGMGLTRFVDPKDHRIYMHSQFEPYYANRMFPCFDQPDLKATFILNAKVPSGWIVTTSNLEKTKITTNDGFTIWSFPKSQTFSTYLFSLHAGEYKVWQGPAFKIPLRLLARQSLAEYIDPKEWFSLTVAGFNFYNAYFDYPYAFEKYDQVIAPEFNAGAMENVGNVAFSENYVVRGKKTRAEKRRLASTLLHEMAHMWFGDLVTMKWWNDLWLNESFATYMSQLCMYEATEFKESWLTFTGQKAGAMLSDQLVTTHPIESDVKDIQQTLTAFDGITYGKGASVLNQFSFHIGPENFQKGVRAYFTHFAFKNAERADFTESLEKASPEGLVWYIKDWQGPWLQTANVNTIRADFDCKGGLLTSLSITETAPAAYPVLRPHSFLIAFLKNSETKLGNELIVVKKGKEQIAKLDAKTFSEIDPHGTEAKYDATMMGGGMACPDAVYPNYEDHGYFKIDLDPTSITTFKSGVGTIKEDHLRRLVWNTLWQMVQNGSLSFVDFGNMAAEALKTERNDAISDALVATLVGPSLNSSVYAYYFSSGQSDSAKFHVLAGRLETIVKERLHKAPPDQKKSWLQSLIAASDSANQLAELKNVIRGNSATYLNTPLDQDTRWSIIRHLAVWADPDARALIEQEYKRDPSYSGKLSMIAAKASLPDVNEKQFWVQAFKESKPQFTYSEFGRALSNLFPLKQSPLRDQYSAHFFQDLTDLQGNKSSEEQKLFTWLAPFSCQTRSSDKIDEFLKLHQNLYPEVTKSLKESSDLNQRCEQSVKFSNL